MTFTVISNSFKDGDYLPSDFILSAILALAAPAGRLRSRLIARADWRGGEN